MKTEPYYCPLCCEEEGCGYHGLLRINDSPVPVCTHHSDETNAPDSVPMVPCHPDDDRED